MPTRIVTGRILKSDGEPWVGAQVLFKLNKVSVSVDDDEVFPPSLIGAITDSNGELEADLWVNGEADIPCLYNVFLPGRSTAKIVVTNGSLAPIDLADLIALSDTTVSSGDAVSTIIDERVAAGKVLTSRTVTTTAVVVAGDDVIFADPTAAGFTLTLLSAALRTRVLRITVLGSTLDNAVTVTPAGVETIKGEATLDLYAGDSIALFPRTATAWETI